MVQEVDTDQPYTERTWFLSDIVFDLSWSSVLKLEAWGIAILGLASLHILVMTVAIFFK